MPAGFEVSAFVKAIESRVGQVDVAVRDVVAESAHDLEARVKKGFGTSHPAGTPTPSQPGEPPSVVTGTLRRSLHVEGPTRKGFGTYEAIVGPTVVYARVQELGGGPSQLPARPYVKPAYERFIAERAMQHRLEIAVRGALHV